MNKILVIVFSFLFFSLNWNSYAKSTTKNIIGVVVSHDKELISILGNLDITKKEKNEGFEFVHVNIFDKLVVFVKSGIGKVNSAVAAAVLIDNFHPKFIFSIGTAGAMNKELKAKDIIVSTSTSFNDVDVTGFGYKFGQVPGMPETYHSSKNLVSEAKKAFINNKVKYGLILTGDSFIKDDKVEKKIKHIFPLALAVDMETAAVAQSAYIYKVPFMGIRSISDSTNKKSDIDYRGNVETASKKVAKFFVKLLKRL